jgi:hypothetical protein
VSQPVYSLLHRSLLRALEAAEAYGKAQKWRDVCEQPLAAIAGDTPALMEKRIADHSGNLTLAIQEVQRTFIEKTIKAAALDGMFEMVDLFSQVPPTQERF